MPSTTWWRSRVASASWRTARSSARWPTPICGLLSDLSCEELAAQKDALNAALVERGLGEARLSVVEAFWLATAGGGKALALPVGTSEVGRAFDLQVVDIKRPDSDLTGFGVFDTPTDRLARILYLSSHDNARKIYVQGRLIRDKDA